MSSYNSELSDFAIIGIKINEKSTPYHRKIIYKNGSVEYQNENHERHRDDDKPAYIERCNDDEKFTSRRWVKNNILHRTSGPAYIDQFGERWYENGLLHRREGPAVVYNNGEKQFWLNGVRKSYSEFLVNQ